MLVKMTNKIFVVVDERYMEPKRIVIDDIGMVREFGSDSSMERFIKNNIKVGLVIKK